MDEGPDLKARELLIATHNQGKLREYAQIFAGLPLRLVTLHDAGIETEIEETGTTFVENARLKALGYAALSGMLTLADDSGLEVDALSGAPGVYSARYAPSPTEYRARVLRELQDVPEEKRTARFRCVICIAAPGPDGPIEVGEAVGAVEGRIAHGESGSNGFGYDPIFYLPEYNATMAELDAGVKNSISHRGEAAEQALILLRAYLQD